MIKKINGGKMRMTVIKKSGLVEHKELKHTGFQDINGFDIFEGDTVSHDMGEGKVFLERSNSGSDLFVIENFAFYLTKTVISFFDIKIIESTFNKKQEDY